LPQNIPGLNCGKPMQMLYMRLIKNPQNYSALVFSDMFGDVVSDLCPPQLIGGLGFASSTNIGDGYAPL